MRAARTAQARNTSVIERAVPSSTPVDKNIRRAIELGLVIGLLLGLGAVVLAENSDRRLRSADDLEALTGLPLLSTIPTSAFSSRDEPDPRAEESFKRLRGALTYFNVDRHLSTIIVSSPSEEDGKTTVAVRLAMATARAGQRVVLVEADLRRPQVASRLGLDPAEDGLGSILAGEHTAADVLVDHQLGGEAEQSALAGGCLLVLPAGPPPPNPSELLGSHAMREVLQDLESQADVVIIDTPALLAVSDALPLFPAASGVVMVARLDRTTRAAVRRLQQTVATTGASVLGVVATGTGQEGEYGAYGYGYGREKRSGWLRGRRHRTAPSTATPPAKQGEQAETPPKLTAKSQRT